MLVYAAMIGGGVLLTRAVEAGRVRPLFLPTPTPTRTALSWQQEAATWFAAGDLEQAILAYQAALAANPEEARLWAELARVQTYSSALVPTEARRRERLVQARASADRAVALAPEDSMAQAIRALVYDWSAEVETADREALLAQARAAANQAQRLDPGHPLAMAFLAEILADEQDYAGALDLAEQAAELAPDSMDVRRVYATVLESNGLYHAAIEQYQAAARINPNLTFLYLRIGANYRRLAGNALNDLNRRGLVDLALESFQKAARINEQLDIEDPIPYLAIGRTYLQEGEFFIAARNVEKALSLDPGNAELYGFLGIVYFKARNYESAIVVLQCAVDGCGLELSRAFLCERVYNCDRLSEEELAQIGAEVPGLPLGPSTLEFYYTYGSALAFFGGSPLAPTGCQEAERVFRELEAVYGSDPIVAGIVAEGRSVCASPRPFPTPTPGPTPAAGTTTTP
jgi:tetratricopeptide (TPR) repeat protein